MKSSFFQVYTDSKIKSTDDKTIEQIKNKMRETVWNFVQWHKRSSINQKGEQDCIS